MIGVATVELDRDTGGLLGSCGMGPVASTVAVSSLKGSLAAPCGPMEPMQVHVLSLT